MSSYLITGAGKGIGLELTGQLVQLNVSQITRIFVLTRSPPTPELEETIKTSGGRVIHIQADITVQSEVDTAVEKLTSIQRDQGLDVLVNNAAVQWPSDGGVSTMSIEQLQSLFSTNVCGVQRMTLAFLPLLRKGRTKKIVNLSSTLGSISTASLWAAVPVPAYKISKAALNMLTVLYALELAPEGFTVFAINPGNVQTDLGGGSDADLDIKSSIVGLIESISNANPNVNGTFLNVRIPGWEDKPIEHRYNGKEWTW